MVAVHWDSQLSKSREMLIRVKVALRQKTKIKRSEIEIQKTLEQSAQQSGSFLAIRYAPASQQHQRLLEKSTEVDHRIVSMVMKVGLVKVSIKVRNTREEVGVSLSIAS